MEMQGTDSARAFEPSIDRPLLEVAAELPDLRRAEPTLGWAVGLPPGDVLRPRRSGDDNAALSRPSLKMHAWSGEASGCGGALSTAVNPAPQRKRAIHQDYLAFMSSQHIKHVAAQQHGRGE